jgi:hypothetical protein
MKTCAAINCRHPVSEDMLFCPTHYREIPADIQKEIRNLWRQGEKRGTDDIKHRWLYAAMRARDAVAKKEGYPVPFIPAYIKELADRESERVAA